jgi:hypothetical protein
MEKIYEGSTVAVKAALPKEHAQKLKSLTFKFLADGAPAKADKLSEGSEFEKAYKASDFGNGLPEDKAEGMEVIAHRVAAPGVPGEQDFYVLTYHIFSEMEAAAGKTVQSQELSVKQFQVFPRSASLKATGKDGKAFPGFRFKVMQNGAQVGDIRQTLAHDTQDVTGATIPAGSAVFNLDLQPGFTVVQESPYEIVKQSRDAKDKRKVSLEGDLKFRAAFVNPSAGRVRQFVNFDPVAQGQGGIGHEVSVDFGVAGEAPAGKLEIHFRATFGPEAGGSLAKSKRKDDKHPTRVEKADAADKAVIEEKKAGELYQGKVELNGGVGRLKLRLGRAGGDTCKLEIAGSDKFLTDKAVQPDQVLEFENWRQVHYELMVPDTLFGEAIDPDTLELQDDAKARLEALGRQLFIAFEHDDTTVFEAVGKADHGTLGPKRFFGLPGGENPAYVLSGRNWRQAPAGQAWAGDNPGKTLYVSLCDLLLKWKKDTADQAAGPKDFCGTLTEKSGVIDAQQRFQGLFMPFSGFDGGDGVTGVAWTADIAKDDPLCAIKPALAIKETRYDFIAGDEAIVEVAPGAAFGMPLEVRFRKGPSGKFDAKLSPGQTAELQKLVATVLGDARGLSLTGGKVEADLSCPKLGGIGEDQCLAAVKAKFQEEFDKAKKATAYHPGLTDAGEPRTGTCSLGELTDFAASTSEQWHFVLPEAMADGSVGPGNFVGAKTKTTCPVKLEFSFQPHEVSAGEAEGKLLAWACALAGAENILLRLVLRSLGEGEKSGLEHGHGGEGRAGDCLEKADALCDKCREFGRAAALAAI